MNEWDKDSDEDQSFVCDPTGWPEFLDSFEKKVLPLFTARGYTKNAALQVFQQNQLLNRVSELMDTIEEHFGG